MGTFNKENALVGVGPGTVTGLLTSVLPGGGRVRVDAELAAAAAQPPGPRPQRPARPPRPHPARGRAGAGQRGHLGRGRHQDAG